MLSSLQPLQSLWRARSALSDIWQDVWFDPRSMLILLGVFILVWVLFCFVFVAVVCLWVLFVLLWFFYKEGNLYWNPARFYLISSIIMSSGNCCSFALSDGSSHWSLVFVLTVGVISWAWLSSVWWSTCHFLGGWPISSPHQPEGVQKEVIKSIFSL